MDWFNYTFPPLMLLIPLIVAIAVPRNRKAKTDLKRARVLTRWLWGATGVALGLWLLIAWMVDASWSYWMWLLFFPLFFGLTTPILRAKNPDSSEMPPHDLPVRSASLESRQRELPVPRWALWSMWLLWALGFGLIAALVDWGVLIGSDESLAVRCRMGWGALLAMGAGVSLPALMTIAVRQVRMEPAPLAPKGSTELRALHDARRRQRAWMFVGMAWTMLLLFAVLFGGMALFSRGMWPAAEAGQMLGVLGGIAGTVVGIVGAILGTLSTAQAARINRRLRELTT